METSARLSLPLLAPGQAQKELFHNEALALVDIALQASVRAVGVDAPPSDPAAGECWVVGKAPTGEWTGHADAVVGWTPNGWRFVTASEGMAVWNGGRGLVARYAAGSWTTGRMTAAAVVVGGDQVVGARQPAITPAQGGATVDAEARAVLSALLTALRTHGLIAT